MIFFLIISTFNYYLFIYLFLIFIYSFIYLFIHLWLCWVFVSVRGLPLVAASGGHSSSRCAGLSLSRPLLLRSTGSRHAGSVVVAHGPSCSAACGIFPDQGSNQCPLHWQADSQPPRHQGSPCFRFKENKNLHKGESGSHPCSAHSLFFFFINFIYLCICVCMYWLRRVFLAAHRLSLVVVSGGYSSLWCAGFSLRWLLLLRSTRSRCTGFSSCGTWAQ